MTANTLTVGILGMHRSGTSCLTGCLQEAGLYLGKHHRWNPYNRRGNRENQDFCDLNNSVLESNFASWKEPVSGCLWSEAQILQGQRLVEAYQSFPQWGFKDPRTLLTLEGWCRIISDLQFVGVFRHPLCVAESLHKRDGLPYDQCFALWLFYNNRLLRVKREVYFPLLNFDWPKALFEQKVRGLAESFGLEGEHKNTEESFYTPSLKHQLADDWSGVPKSCRALYYELVAVSEEQVSNVG
ncbi:MAG: sulfotransferase family protein [Gammaproteobacteria bacterium]|nr:MAG: sulfotransferase family protein [Gammaproteobacteria bacterium]